MELELTIVTILLNELDIQFKNTRTFDSTILEKTAKECKKYVGECSI